MSFLNQDSKGIAYNPDGSILYAGFDNDGNEQSGLYKLSLKNGTFQSLNGNQTDRHFARSSKLRFAQGWGRSGGLFDFRLMIGTSRFLKKACTVRFVRFRHCQNQHKGHPDETQLIFDTNLNGTSNLWAMDLPDAYPYQLSFLNQDSKGIA